MGVGSGLYMYDVVVKRSRSLSHLLMSSCINTCQMQTLQQYVDKYKCTANTVSTYLNKKEMR